MSSNERKGHLDILRIFATYAVVLLHIGSKRLGGGNREVFLIYDGLVRWAVPMFVMISGTLFLDENYKLSISKMWRKIFRLGTAFVFWTIIYCVFEKSRGSNSDIIRAYAVNGYWHMWFVFMISGLYIISPLLKEISKSITLTKYYLVIALIFTSIVPTIKNIILPYTGLSDNIFVVAFFKNIDIMYMYFVMGFTAYFLLGHYLNSIEINRKNIYYFFVLGVIGFITNVHCNLRLNAQMVQTYNDCVYCSVVMECVGLYGICKYFFNNLNSSLLVKLSDCCFGTYLVHLLYRELLDLYFGLNADTFNPIYWNPILALIIFSLSLATSFIIHQIPGFRKYVV